MANLPLGPKQHLDGKRWLPLLKGKAMDRGPIFWHYPHYGNQGGSPCPDGHQQDRPFWASSATRTPSFRADSRPKVSFEMSSPQLFHSVAP